MAARYLIRLDDACAEMDCSRWTGIETVLDEFNVKPIVAVVPNNQDAELKRQPADADFWSKVRRWQAKGWSIAMHGHTHVMHPTDERLLVPYYKRSEFAGLAYDEQKAKIRTAWDLFLSEGIEPRIWVAPAHSFNGLTLKALREETSIRIVSDGIAWNTFYEQGFHWIPQQIWKLTPRKSGLWTVCLHPNQMDDGSLSRFRHDIGGEFRHRIISVDDVRLTSVRKSLRGRIYDAYFWLRWRRANPSYR
jgi:predicted deacetylase